MARKMLRKMLNCMNSPNCVNSPTGRKEMPQKATERANPAGTSVRQGRTMRALRACVFGCAALSFWMPAGHAAVTTFSAFPAGALPEDIVLAPAGFGTLGGNYLVPNPTQNFSGAGVVNSVPGGGGP